MRDHATEKPKTSVRTPNVVSPPKSKVIPTPAKTVIWSLGNDESATWASQARLKPTAKGRGCCHVKPTSWFRPKPTKATTHALRASPLFFSSPHTHNANNIKGIT